MSYYQQDAPDIADSGVSCYEQDALGSTVATLDSAGLQTGSYDYSAFGLVLPDSTTAQPAPQFAFMGNQQDLSAQTDDFNARTYSASSGRFLSPDPIPGQLTLPQTLDPYVYGADNPYATPDPTGLSIFSDISSGAEASGGHRRLARDLPRYPCRLATRIRVGPPVVALVPALVEAQPLILDDFLYRAVEHDGAVHEIPKLNRR